MLKDLIRFTNRHFRRGPGFGMIKIAGLTIGLTSFLLIAIFVLEELSYDRYHTNRDAIYRVSYSIHSTASNETDSVAWVSSLVGPKLKEDFPEVVDFCRVRNLGGTSMLNGTQTLEQKLFFADASVFSVFTFPFIRGNSATALSDPYTIVMTESMANRHFGGRWRTMDLGAERFSLYLGDDTLDLQVTGIIKDVPQNSHFTFNALISYKTRETIYPFINGWFALGTHTYVLAKPEIDAPAFERKIAGMVMRYYGEDARKLGYELNLFIQPLLDIHLKSNLGREIEANGQLQHVYIFSALGFFILVLAIINFINLSTAQSTKFGKQTGIRRISGSTRFQLIRLFMFDSFVYAAGAGLLALGIVEMLFPYFNQFLGRELPGLLERPWLVGVIFPALIICVTLLGGGYPAYILSSVRPVAVLNNRLQPISASRLRHGLIVFQFAVSFVFAICAFTIYRQIDFMMTKTPGYEKRNVVVIDAWTNSQLRANAKALENELERISHVEDVTVSQSVPGQGLLQRTTRREGMDTWVVMESLITGVDFLDVYDFELASGRTFSRDIEWDISQAFVINQAAARSFGWTDEEAIGKNFEWGTQKQGQIIGVVKDFHYRSLHEIIVPVVVHLAERGHGYISVRLKEGAFSAGLQAIEERYRLLYPDQLFQFFVLDENFNLQYASDEKLGLLAFIFCGLSFFIACIGLVGLSALIVDDRRKEIGIRKVLGATSAAILIMLNKRFSSLVFLAVLVGIPCAYFAADQWLQQFAYRTEITSEVFIVAAIASLLVTTLTVSYHSLKASIINPVETIKYE